MNLRLLGLAGTVVCALALPLAVASAGPVGDRDHAAARPPSGSAGATGPMRSSGLVGPQDPTDASGPPAPSGYSGPSGSLGSPGSVGSPGSFGEAPPAGQDAKARAARPSRTPLLLGLGLATAARCGPELTSPEGIEAQTCVLTQGGDTWARTYYRNATGDAVDAVLTLMGPEDRTVRTSCAVGAGDDPRTCETPRESSRGGFDGYTAVTEFAARAGRGPLLLRSGSNSGAPAGS
ncbi:hypothetical protein [Streptomyces griseoviridis]|uniref:hypothetical protein n=1 Tax=Streptomyces griseoviridis TaxID=45398 RepID=UPI0034447711